MSDRFPTTKEIVIRCNEPGKVVFVAMMSRIGLSGWMTELEYTHFKPDTPANELITVFLMKWPDDSMYWVLVQIPENYGEVAKHLLFNHGLKVAGEKDPEGGPYVSAVITGEGIQKFPIFGNHVFFIENHSKGTKHVAYTNDPEKLAAANAAEDAIVKRFHEEHGRWLADPNNKAAAEAYWASRPDLYPPEE